MPSDIPELIELHEILEQGAPWLERRTLAEVNGGKGVLPVHAVALGSPAANVPIVGFFGGVHGLERIGAQVVMAYLRSLVLRLRWDEVLHRQLETMRLVFVPIVNPGGLVRGTRANPNGVDLMRNAPLDAKDHAPFLLGGHRLGPGLPWYRGKQDQPMEIESQALCRVVEEELLSREFSIAIDCHSGFGMKDRIWFPYAHTPEPIAHLAQMFALKEVFDETHAYHPYVFEPQSLQYLAHGDLWDYLYLRACERPERTFLPLTLEMGSWLWVKKNPRQLLSRHGMFNPSIKHRQHRVLRRHVILLEFLSRAAYSYRRWLPDMEAGARLRERALQHWYGRST